MDVFYYFTVTAPLPQTMYDILCQAGCRLVPHHNYLIDVLTPYGTSKTPFKVDDLQDVFTVTFPGGTSITECFDSSTNLSVLRPLTA